LFSDDFSSSSLASKWSACTAAGGSVMIGTGNPSPGLDLTDPNGGSGDANQPCATSLTLFDISQGLTISWDETPGVGSQPSGLSANVTNACDPSAPLLAGVIFSAPAVSFIVNGSIINTYKDARLNGGWTHFEVSIAPNGIVSYSVNGLLMEKSLVPVRGSGSHPLIFRMQSNCCTDVFVDNVLVTRP
jgi:hypothetical protein